MSNLLPILSEYQQDERNAKVYRTASGNYGVIVFDANNDYNEFQSFSTEEDAEDFAEDWVTRHGDSV